MTTKRLTTSQLSGATYGKFTRSGVTVDVKRFLRTDSGRLLIQDLRTAAGKSSNVSSMDVPKPPPEKKTA